MIIPPWRFHILIIAVTYYPSLGVALHIICKFAADSTTQGEEVKGVINIGKQAQYITSNHPAATRLSHLVHHL